jgi:protein-S-isoprenylcysteine O-methyltransferase Ste14
VTTMTTALDTDQAKTIGLVAVIVLVVAAVLINLVISRIITRVIVLVVAIGLALFVWTQRSSIEDAAKKCDATFFGVHLTPTDPALKQHCQQLTS